MAAQLECVRVGMLQTNCYALFDDDSCLLVDPGADPKAILAMLDGRVPDVIALTHGHMDHIGALPDVAAATGARIAACADEIPRIVHPSEFDLGLGAPGYTPVEAVDIALVSGDVLQVGDLRFEVVQTPGHTPGGMCLYCADEKLLFSGDTLFAGTCGRTDFPGGSMRDMRESLKRLAALPGDTRVLPGHDQSSTIANELAWITRL